MSVELYLAYVLACLVITIVPGPTVTLIVANSLTLWRRARACSNVAGHAARARADAGRAAGRVSRRSSPPWASGSTGCALRAPPT